MRAFAEMGQNASVIYLFGSESCCERGHPLEEDGVVFGVRSIHYTGVTVYQFPLLTIIVLAWRDGTFECLEQYVIPGTPYYTSTQ